MSLTRWERLKLNLALYLTRAMPRTTRMELRTFTEERLTSELLSAGVDVRDIAFDWSDGDVLPVVTINGRVIDLRLAVHP